MVSVGLSQIYLISKRTEVIAFFEKLLNSSCLLKVYPNTSSFSRHFQQTGKVSHFPVIVDTLPAVRLDEINFFTSEKYISLQKVFFIDSVYSDLKFLVNSENISLNFIPFPCDGVVALNHLGGFPPVEKVFDAENVSEQIPPTLKRFAGNSFSTKSLRNNFYTYGKTDLPLIIEGESGTGKTLAAELIHSISMRKTKRFRRINMPCIQPEIAEAELFGSVSGAFTGAKDKQGIL